MKLLTQEKKKKKKKNNLIYDKTQGAKSRGIGRCF